MFVYSDKDCMNTFCDLLKEHALKMINSKKKKNEVISNRAA